ncbi:MAG TPA: hypothetical protein VN285_10160 [Candidatus Deferrimicrobium sp.]|nr:hypothetical protein [Candidatus Deferrimicrobium sp.]
MRTNVILGFLAVSFIADQAQAANLAVIVSPPTLLNLIILGVGIACVMGAVKVLSLVRGGQMSRSWQLFAAGFGVLVLCEFLLVANAIEIITLPSFVVPAGLAVMSGLFLYGIRETRRVLG